MWRCQLYRQTDKTLHLSSLLFRFHNNFIVWVTSTALNNFVSKCNRLLFFSKNALVNKLCSTCAKPNDRQRKNTTSQWTKWSYYLLKRWVNPRRSIWKDNLYTLDGCLSLCTCFKRGCAQCFRLNSYTDHFGFKKGVNLFLIKQGFWRLQLCLTSCMKPFKTHFVCFFTL